MVDDGFGVASAEAFNFVGANSAVNRSQDYNRRGNFVGFRKINDGPSRMYDGESGSNEVVNFDNHSSKYRVQQDYQATNRPNGDMLFRPRRSFLKRGDRKKAMAANMILNVNKIGAYETQFTMDQIRMSNNEMSVERQRMNNPYSS